MDKDQKILALDVGTASLGWAINNFDDSKDKWDILDFGVRLWDEPSEGKTKKSKTV